MHSSSSKLYPTFILLLLFIHGTTSLRFHLHDRENRCFRFKAPPGARVIGERSVSNGPGRAVLHVKVQTESGDSVHESATADPTPAKFAFRTPASEKPLDHAYHYDEYDYDDDDMQVELTYTACLKLTFDDHMHVPNVKRAVSFWIKHDSGNTPSMHDVKAKEGTVAVVNNAMENMLHSLSGMVADLSALEQRETRLVSRTEANASRLVLLAVLAIIVTVCTAVAQVLHFKTYFKSKKLI